MQLIYFTKFLQALNPQEIGDLATRLTFDGLDLAIRAGQWVNPANVEEALPQAMSIWQEMGLTVPLVTLEGHAIHPEDPEVRSIFAACGEAGIARVKLGYWVWRPDRHYWDEVAAIRDALAGFQELGRQHGVCSLIHTHSGLDYGLNAAAALHLVQDFDPLYVGVYLDFAHLAVAGESIPMALDITRNYLRMVAAKNVRYLPEGDERPARWRREWCLLSEGLVDWPEALGLLRDAGYDGPVSVHGEYSATQETEAVVKIVEEDIGWLREYVPANDSA